MLCLKFYHHILVPVYKVKQTIKLNYKLTVDYISVWMLKFVMFMMNHLQVSI